jgi:hypothetical protein
MENRFKHTLGFKLSFVGYALVFGSLFYKLPPQFPQNALSLSILLVGFLFMCLPFVVGFHKIK